MKPCEAHTGLQLKEVVSKGSWTALEVRFELHESINCAFTVENKTVPKMEMKKNIVRMNMEEYGIFISLSPSLSLSLSREGLKFDVMRAKRWWWCW